MISNPPKGHRLSLYFFSGETGPSGICDCGEIFAWESGPDTRESDHERHVFAVIWEQGANAPHDAMWDGDNTIRNPYEVTK